MAYYVEICGAGSEDTVRIRFERDGGVTLLAGGQNNGQGHETAFAQIAADRLGIPFESIRVIQGDTDQIPAGTGTGYSKALAVTGSATRVASDRIIAKGKALAAHLLEAAEADIEFRDGQFIIIGTDRRISILDLAAASFDRDKLPKGVAPGLDESATFDPPGFTYPNGCHIAEVEIDPATGVTRIMRYTIVDDFGTVVNPLTLAGQVHGGAVQGIGQALYEGCVYDRESGQLVTGSLMDYCLPRADDVPFFAFSYNQVPTKANPLGVKGAGEAGAIPVGALFAQALENALGDPAIELLEIPLSPNRLFEKLRS
jgi:carbon-monoxide dehydrogenase large subunit